MTLRRTAALLAAILLLYACEDRPTLTEPESEADPEAQADPETPQAVSLTGNSVYSDRAHALPPEHFELLSGPAEVSAGRLRYRASEGELPAVVRDDFIVTQLPGGAPEVRRIITAGQEGEELILDTAPAYWHEIIRGGEYRFTIPFGGSDDAALVHLPGVDEPQRLALAGTGMPLPPL
ncbi:MAG TPA: hypothetical protein VLA43_16840, partial [Longimicrobiales bacterium]|nr:hypothetical protein [Longimicrobiales bacterium]